MSISLWRKSMRDLRGMGLRALMIVAVVGVGPGAAAGIALGMDQVQATRSHFYRRYALADVEVRLRHGMPEGKLLAHAAAAGASIAQTRVILGGFAVEGSRQTAAEIVGMRPAARLDRLALLSGRGLSSAAAHGAVIEASYARRRHLHPGDRLHLLVQGHALTITVRGIARSPEFLLATANPEYLLPQPGSLAVAFLPRGGVQRMLGVRGVNDLVADFPGGEAPAHTAAIGAGLPVGKVTPISEQYSRRFTEADVHSFSIFAPVMGIVFAAVGLLLIVLSLHRLVHSQRRELGALAALGYGPRPIAMTVLAPALAIGLAGALLSIGVATGVAALVSNQYSKAVGFPETVHALTAAPLLLAAGLALGATLLAAALPAISLTRLRPTEALRGAAPASFRMPSWLARGTALAGGTGAYAARSLLRRPAMTAATVLSLAAAIGLGGALEVLMSSTYSSIEASLAGEHWDYAAQLAHPLPAAAAARLATRDGASEAEPVVQGAARISSSGGGQEIQLVGLPASPPLRALTLTAGEPPSGDGIDLSEQIAAKLGVTVGSRVRLAASSSSASAPSSSPAVRLRVAGIVRTLAGTEAYLPARRASGLLGMPGKASSIAVRGGPGVARRLSAEPAISRVSSRAGIMRGQRELTSELTGLLDVLLAISLGVGALFLLSSIAISHLDREGELATLRALGHGRRQIAGIVLGEALVQTLLAAALSVPIALLIALPLRARIAKAWFAITLSTTPADFLIVILPGIALALIIASQATRRVLSLDIARTVRARLIG